MASITDSSIKKLKQVYSKYMFEAGLIAGKVSEKQIVKPYIEPELRSALMRNGMKKYLAGLTGH